MEAVPENFSPTQPDLRESKARLRERVLAELAKMSPAAREKKAAAARALLERQGRWQAAQAILFFASLPGELDLWPLLGNALAMGKTVVLPRFNRAGNRYSGCQVTDVVKDLVRGKFGVREPISNCAVFPFNRLDFVLVPGVAFDLHGRRLGRGKGFYDQILTAVRGTTCGVAFDEQVVREVPVGPHDVSLNCLLTPTRWVELQQRAVME